LATTADSRAPTSATIANTLATMTAAGGAIKQITEVTYMYRLPQGQKTNAYAYFVYGLVLIFAPPSCPHFFFLSRFWAFRKNGNKKNMNRSKTKISRLFSSSIFLLGFLLRFGRFVTRGVKKRDNTKSRFFSAAAKKSSYVLTSLCFYGAPWQQQTSAMRARSAGLYRYAR
jgi:hypothetical protein